MIENLLNLICSSRNTCWAIPCSITFRMLRSLIWWRKQSRPTHITPKRWGDTLESVFNVNELLFYSLCGSVLQISFKVYPFRLKSAQASYEAFKSRHLNANRRLQVGLFLIVGLTERVQSLFFFCRLWMDRLLTDTC